MQICEYPFNAQTLINNYGVIAVKSNLVWGRPLVAHPEGLWMAINDRRYIFSF